MDGNGAQMEDDEEEEEEGSPDDNNMGGQGMSTDDYEEIDYKICGELGKQEVIDIHNFFQRRKTGPWTILR